MQAEFSERDFEFCFNAAYLQKNAGSLVAVPFIPSQRLERVVGWDVRFRLKQGRTRRSVFIQHKRPSYTAKPRGRAAAVFKRYGGPYYRFPVASARDAHQFNRLTALANRGRSVEYTAAAFHRLSELEAAFSDGTLLGKTMYISPKGQRAARDKRPHSYSFVPDRRFAFHSEMHSLGTAVTWDALLDQTIGEVIDDDYARRLLEDLIGAMRDAEPGRNAPRLDMDDELGIAGQIVHLLARDFGLAWYLV